jgi:phage replication O-like protein O
MFKPDGVNESPAKITIPILQDFTKIPNTLLDALCQIRIPGEVRQVLDAIVRNSLGWNRQEAELSLNKLSEITGIKHSNIVRCIKRLESMNIIITNRVGKTCAYGINLDVSQWHKKKTDTGKLSEVIPAKFIKNDMDASIKNDTLGSIKTDTDASIKNDTLGSIKTDTDASIKTDTPLIKSKDKLKKSKAKQNEKPLACFSDNEKAQAQTTTPATEPEHPATAPVTEATVPPATALTPKEVFQSLFGVAVPGNFQDLDAISEMVRRKQAGKLTDVKNPLGYLNSITGKVAPIIAMPAPVQQTTAGKSFFETETPRMSHAEMAKINDIWDSMTEEERKSYEARALPKFEKQAGRYKTSLRNLARSIFNSEQLQKWKADLC